MVIKGVGQPANEGDDSVSPLGIRLKPTSGKFSNIYQQGDTIITCECVSYSSMLCMRDQERVSGREKAGRREVEGRRRG